MDPNRFRELALQELEAVHRLAYHLASRPQEADDLVQETYLRAFKYADSFELAGHGLRPWLFRILHNVLNTRLAKERRQPAAVDDLTDYAGPARPDEPPCDHLSQLDWDHVDQRLKAEIVALPLIYRSVFLLCAIEGLRYREIAEVLDLPIGTVMSRLHRSRQVLIEKLGEWAAENGMAGRPAASATAASEVTRGQFLTQSPD